MPTIAELRQSDPTNLGQLSDDSIVRVLKATDYPDKSEAEIAKMLGVKAAAPPAPPPSGFVRRFVADPLLSLGSGVIGVPQTLVGLADMATGGHVGKALHDYAGVDFTKAQQILADHYSPEQQQANQNVQDAKGFFPTVKAMIDNPSTIAHQAIQSSLTALTGGGIARGVLWAGLSAAEKAAVLALPVAERAGAVAELAGAGRTITASSIGEGATAAGQNVEQVREDGPTGLLTPMQSAVNAGAGIITAGIGRGVGATAERMGLGDVNTMLAAGHLGTVSKAGAEAAASKGFVRKVAEGAAIGAAQEVPQSYQEQVAQNIAEGKPWDEGALEQAAQGGMAGAAMEAAGAPMHRGNHAEPAVAPVVVPPVVDDPRAAKLPETGPMSKAINAGLDAAGERQDAGLPPAAPPAPPGPPPFTPLPVDPADVDGLLAHANQRAADLEAKAAGTKDDTIRPDGEKLVVAGAPKQFLTPDEKAELAFLKEHGGNAEALNQVYTRDPDAAITRMHQAAADEAQSLRQFDRAPATAAPAAPAVQAAPQQDDANPNPMPGDVLNPKGEPFKNRTAVVKAQKALDDPTSHVIASVNGGWVLRPNTTTENSDESGRTAQPGENASAGPAVAAAPGGNGSVVQGQLQGGPSAGPITGALDSVASADTAGGTAAVVAPALSEASAPKPVEASMTPGEVDQSATPSATRPQTLPKDLAGATPRYSYGPKRFELKFASDLDKSAYIAAQDTPSKRDADYVAHAVAASGMTEPQVRAHGVAVRAAIKAMAKAAKPGVLNVPEVARAGAKVQTDIQPATPHRRDEAEAYAAQRAKETGQPYLVTAMGHAMPDVPDNRRLANNDLGGVAARATKKDGITRETPAPTPTAKEPNAQPASQPEATQAPAPARTDAPATAAAAELPGAGSAAAQADGVKPAEKPARPAEQIELRKRLSVLQQLMECI